ncbi:hypothetical protein Pint_29815 [Pistacia integerrima]|uniref:Uncharacterized protein n=1 Tax=Pistacia integerrima TaxID=434235 RepID=A0ACC0WZE2_9ROSI|nr:hypothetical protein Pint_29815 [Pistacia integerrima]
MAREGRNEILISFSCLILLFGVSYSQTDRLLQGQVLKDGDQLVSAFGNFRLGFFSPEGTRNRYLGIWYYKPKDRSCPFQSNLCDAYYYYMKSAVKNRTRPVWVANRNTPISDKSGKLIIDRADGNLKILHGKGNPIVISSIQAAGNTSATLEKNGNFVLYEMYSNGSKLELWQSFDYPTDTLLPGMKLGINMQTGHKWFLRSWTADGSPAQGSFTLGMDPNVTNQLIIWWDGDAWWRSGLWQNGNVSSFFDSKRDYSFSYTTNEQEKYFSYSVNEDVTSFPILQISSTGALINDQESSVANSQDDYPDCRAKLTYFDIRTGCTSGKGFKFNMTIAHCKAKCMKNCSCVAFASTNKINDTGCEIWSRETKFIESSSHDSRQIYMEVVIPKRSNAEKNPRRKNLIIGGGVALVRSGGTHWD